MVLQRELGTDMSPAAAALREEALAMPLDLPWERRLSRHAPIPRPTTPTIGRRGDLEGVVAMLRQAPVVTLLGPGGVGKTRLAVEVALAEAATVDGLLRRPDQDLQPGARAGAHCTRAGPPRRVHE